MRGAAGQGGARAITRVATRAHRVGVEGHREGRLAAALVVPAPPAKPGRATGSVTTAAPRSPDTATARTSSGTRAVTNVSMEKSSPEHKYKDMSSRPIYNCCSLLRYLCNSVQKISPKYRIYILCYYYYYYYYYYWLNPLQNAHF